MIEVIYVVWCSLIVHICLRVHFGWNIFHNINRSFLYFGLDNENMFA